MNPEHERHIEKRINEKFQQFQWQLTHPSAQQPQPQPRMEFSKKAFIFASVMFAASWTVAVISWFTLGEIPWEFKQWVSLMYTAAFTSYCGKTAYENKSKILNSRNGVQS